MLNNLNMKQRKLGEEKGNPNSDYTIYFIKKSEIASRSRAE